MHLYRALLLISIIYGSIACAPLDAQAPFVGPGKRVRVASATFDGTGIVVGRTGSDLTLAVENRADLVVTPLSSISRLEVRRSLSTGEGALKGAKWGLAIGGGFALFAGAITGLQSPEDEISGIEMASIMIIEGAVIGAIIGAIRPGGRWERAATGPRLSAGAFGRDREVAVRVPL